MKLLKLSLVAAFAVGSISTLQATTLEEAIKNVDFSGWLRYRYDTGNWDKTAGINEQSSVASKQASRFKAKLGAKADIGDGFKIFGQLEYAQDTNGGYGPGSQAQTGNPINLRQAYVQYDLADYGTSFILGRQELDTIWTSDMAGMAAKTLYTPAEGTTLAVFAVDSFNQDPDRAFGTITYNPQSDFLYRQNMYGAAAIGSYDVGGKLDTQLWLAYLNKRATLYALTANYTLPLGDDMSYGLQFTYLGNSVDNTLKEKFQAANGNFINLMGTFKAVGFDGSLGGVFYGKKGNTTINSLEDYDSSTLAAGKEMFYLRGSNITNSFGQTTIGYVKAGYTLPSDLRIGVQYLMGSTKTGDATNPVDGGGDKSEIVAELNYNYTKKLNFQLWYSYLNWKKEFKANTANTEIKDTKNTVRFQAIYNF